MPEGSAVDKLYKKLRAEGKSEESAARIAQSVTGEALATGKPPKGQENSEPTERTFSVGLKMKDGTEKVVRLSFKHTPGHGSYGNRIKGEVERQFPGARILESREVLQNSFPAFERGRQRALNAISRIGNKDTESFDEGFSAQIQGIPRGACPYKTPEEEEKRLQWQKGWNKAEKG